MPKAAEATQQKTPAPAPAAAMRWDGKATQLPRQALQFRSPVKFDEDATPNPNAGNGNAGAVVPFTMTARSGDPIYHWYWGRVVHDLAGMQLSKETLPVDYCHDPREVLGYADKFDASTGDLVVSGALTPFDPEDGDDRASEIVYKQKKGVPYEASIDFSAGKPVIEYVPEGASVQVNGGTFDGPGVVMRQWTLRGLAICPYGADPNTATEFSAGGSGNAAGDVAIAIQGEAKMSKGNEAAQAAATATVTTSTTPATPPAATQLAQGNAPAAPAAASATPAAQPKPHDKYVSAFGAVGAQWFLDEKPFEECVTEFNAKVKADHGQTIEALKTQFAAEKAALQGQLDAANKKLSAIGASMGADGVTFSNADGKNVDPKAAKLQQNLGEGLGRFAASIKLPGQK